MRVKVGAYGFVRRAIGDRITVELECKAKVKDLISKLMSIAERARRKLPDPSKTDDESLIILLNGRNIHSLKGFETELKEGDILIFMPMPVGG